MPSLLAIFLTLSSFGSAAVTVSPSPTPQVGKHLEVPPPHSPESPPPSTYDLLPEEEKSNPLDSREHLGLAQWARTILALGIVLALIYLSKFALIRFHGLRNGGPENNLNIIERVQLDPKHSLFIVDIKDKGRVLLGGGNGALRLLANLDQPAPNTPPDDNRPKNPNNQSSEQSKSDPSHL